MISSVRISIKDYLSANLSFRGLARDFFNYIESLPEKKILVDFLDTKFISRSFAHEYLLRKSRSPKRITEINVPINIQKMFDIVSAPRKKSSIIDHRSVEIIDL
jgi:hypothetical protein